MLGNVERLTVGEAAAAAGLTVRRVNQILDGGVFPKRLFHCDGQRAIAVEGLALLMLEDAAMDHLTPAARKRVLAALAANPARAEVGFASFTASVLDLRRRAAEGLMRLACARKAVQVSSAAARLRGHDVHQIARRLQGDPASAPRICDETGLDAEALAAAALFAKAYPRRGRPRRAPVFSAAA